jgi:NitT/TauT family transport system substrate-binding protein
MFHRNGATKRRLAALTAAAAVLALAGCGSSGSSDAQAGNGKPLTKVTVTLNFLAGAPNSGFMVAKEKGYYADQGLDVKIQEGQGSNSTATLVAGGKSEFGYADGPSGITVASQGGDLINIGPILQTNGFSVMALKKSGIKKISDLKGKSVALQPGTAQASLFNAVLATNNLDPKSVNIENLDPSALVASLLQGSVDAITAGADTQAVQLRDQGADINEVLYRDAGVPTVGLSMLTQASYAKAHADIVKSFVAASLKGWDDARKNADAAAETVAKQFPQGASVTSIKEQFAVDKTLLCAPGSQGLAKVPDKNWKTTYDLMVQYLKLPTTKPITDYYTTDYLPSTVPSC